MVDDRRVKRTDFVNPAYRQHYIQQNKDVFQYRMNPVKFTQCRKCTETGGSCYVSTYNQKAGQPFPQHRS